jgi:phage gp45-like
MIGEITQIGTDETDGAEYRTVQVEFDTHDVRDDVELMSLGGIDCCPVVGSQVVTVQLSTNVLVAVATDDKITPTSEPGEFEIYSSASGGKLARIKLNAAGEVEIHLAGEDNATGTAVRFAELKAGFDQLKSDLNGLISAYAGHGHTCPSGGGPTTALLPPTPPPPSASTASIDGAEVTGIRIPGGSP